MLKKERALAQECEGIELQSSLTRRKLRGGMEEACAAGETEKYRNFCNVY